MSMLPRKQSAHPGLDLAQILRMTEPLTVHITRIRAGSRETIPLMPREGYEASGVGWTIDEVKAIEQEIVQIAGGGSYEGQVTDSTKPDAATHKWSFYLPTDIYPVTAPTTLSPTMPPVNSTPNSLGAATPIPQNREQTLRDELHRRDLQALDSKHQYTKEINEVKQIVQALQIAPRSDDRVERLERELAESRIRAERMEEQRRRDEDMRRIESQLAADRQRSDEKFNALMAQMAQLAQQAARPSGPDPMILMLIETQKAAADSQREAARAAAEAQREAARIQSETDRERARAESEIARVQAEQQQRLLATMQTMMAPNMMSPMEAARIVREASSSADGFTRSVIGSMNELLNVQQQYMSSMIQLAPQGEGVAGRVVDAIEKIGESYTKGQAQVEAAKANAQSETAKAQAHVQAQMLINQRAQQQAQLGGTESQPTVTAATATPPAAPPVQVLAEPDAAKARTDKAWFGPALADVVRLRDGVKSYLDAVAGDEAHLLEQDGQPTTVVSEDGKPIGVSPYLAAQIILMAANEIRSKNIPDVQAFSYFYENQMYQALLNVLLPKAPEEYRVQVILYITRLLRGENIMQAGDAPMYGVEKYLSSDDE